MDVYLLVQFLDAAERIASLIYRLVVQYDDAANAGLGNFEDVRTDAGLLITALNALTWDSILSIKFRLSRRVAVRRTSQVTIRFAPLLA